MASARAGVSSATITAVGVRAPFECAKRDKRFVPSTTNLLRILPSPNSELKESQESAKVQTVVLRDPISRKRAEAVWLEKLKRAEARYQTAATHARQLQAESLNRTMASADGTFALQQALRIETKARAEYVRVLRIFSELILHGRQPDENVHRAG